MAYCNNNYRKKEEKYQVNKEIRDQEVRVISSTGEMLGVMSAKAAQYKAYDEGLDLVKISPNANPPVCKIMDYPKFKYEQAKKEKENKKNQVTIEVKEIRLSMTIDVGDIDVRAKQCLKFLEAGNKVKVSIRMKGRENSRSNLGIEVMNNFFSKLNNKAIKDKEPYIEGRSIVMMLSPSKAY